MTGDNRINAINDAKKSNILLKKFVYIVLSYFRGYFFYSSTEIFFIIPGYLENYSYIKQSKPKKIFFGRSKLNISQSAIFLDEGNYPL